jgi:hypothetical protein
LSATTSPKIKNKNTSIYIVARFIHHITIPSSVAIAMVSIMLGLATSFEWSYKVTGSPEYMMMLFGKLNPEVIIMLFAIITLFTIFPIFMGLAVSEFVRTDSSTPSKKLRKTKIFFMFVISFLIPLSIYASGYPIKEWPSYVKFFRFLHFSHLWLLLLESFLLMLFGLLAITLYDNPKRSLWAWLIVPVAAFFGGIYGIWIIFMDIIPSSISHTTSAFATIIGVFVLCGTVLLMLFAGMRNGDDSSAAFLSFVGFSVIISIALLALDTPQNVIMRLNNGIIPVYRGLDRGLTRAIWREDGSTDGYYQCAYHTMYAIKEHDETFFSCKEKIIHNKTSVIPKNKYYHGIVINNVTHKIIYDAIADKRYKKLSYNINCIRRIDGQFLCEREVAVPFPRNQSTDIKPKKSTFPESGDAHTGS